MPQDESLSSAFERCRHILMNEARRIVGPRPHGDADASDLVQETALRR